MGIFFGALFVGLHVAIAAIGFITRRHVVHLVAPILWFTLTVYYVMMSLVGPISA